MVVPSAPARLAAASELRPCRPWRRHAAACSISFALLLPLFFAAGWCTLMWTSSRTGAASSSSERRGMRPLYCFRVHLVGAGSGGLLQGPRPRCSQKDSNHLPLFSLKPRRPAGRRWRSCARAAPSPGPLMCAAAWWTASPQTAAWRPCCSPWGMCRPRCACGGRGALAELCAGCVKCIRSRRCCCCHGRQRR